MIAATLNWLLLAMWHANHLSNSHVIGKLENQTLPKKHDVRFYEWNGTFRTFGQIRVMSFQYPRWNAWTPCLHHVSLFVKYCHQLFTISFHKIPMILISCRSSQKCIESAIKRVLSKGRSGDQTKLRQTQNTGLEWPKWEFYCMIKQAVSLQFCMYLQASYLLLAALMVIFVQLHKFHLLRRDDQACQAQEW